MIGELKEAAYQFSDAGLFISRWALAQCHLLSIIWWYQPPRASDRFRGSEGTGR
jgi:hypothetical protein